MSPTETTRLLVVAMVIVTVIGAVDAAIGGEWDLFVLFAVSLALSLALVARLETRRPAIPIRRDLVVWLRDRAAVSGEPLTTVADRALSAYRERYGHVRSGVARVADDGRDRLA